MADSSGTSNEAMFRSNFFSEIRRETKRGGPCLRKIGNSIEQRDYLIKQESKEQLLDAIRTVLSGQRIVSATMAQRLVGQALGISDQTKTPIEHLSNGELEIFRLIGEGSSSGVITEQLVISKHTIDTHHENIKRKLGIPNAGELTRAAVQWVLENG